jgi:hypothetical protein
MPQWLPSAQLRYANKNALRGRKNNSSSTPPLFFFFFLVVVVVVVFGF